MKNVPLLLFFLTALTVSAQQSILSGTVTVFNSQFETGKKQYVANAQVEDDFKKSQATTTNNEGVFKLPLVGIKDLDKVFFNVKKANYEVVNTDALQAVAGQKEIVQVYLALEGTIVENKRKYYKINLVASEKALKEKLDQLDQQIKALQPNKEANKTKIEVLQVEYGRLQESFKKIDETAKELAERYAKTNLDDASSEHQRAFRYFQRGLLDSALYVFQKMDLEQTAKFVVSEQNRTAALKTEYETRNTEKNKQKRQTKEALLFKADLHQTKYDFVKADVCYRLLLRLDSTNSEINFMYAFFLQKQNQFSKIEKYYLKALSLNNSNENKAHILNNLGVFYRENQKMVLAEKFHIEALGINRVLALKTPSIYSTIVANNLINLGLLYSENNKNEQAEASYIEALQIFTQMSYKTIDVFLVNIALVLNNLGVFYSDNNQMIKAEKAYNSALRAYRQLEDNNSDTYLDHLSNIYMGLGELYRVNYRLGEAEFTFSEALQIKRRLANKNPNMYMADVAKNLNNMGIIYASSQKTAEANETFIESLSILRTLVKENPKVYMPDLAFVLKNFGSFYRKNFNKAVAESSLIEALNIYRELSIGNPDKYSIGVAETLHNLGDMYIFDKRLERAESVLKESLQIFNQLSKSNPNKFKSNIAITSNNLGLCYALSGKIIEAQQIFENSLAIFRELVQQNPSFFELEIARTLSYLGTAYKNRDQNKSYSCFTEALQLALKYPDLLLAQELVAIIKAKLKR